MQTPTVYLSPRSAASAIAAHCRQHVVQPGTIFRRVARVVKNPDGTVDHGVCVLVKNRGGYLVGVL